MSFSLQEIETRQENAMYYQKISCIKNGDYLCIATYKSYLCGKWIKK